MDSTLALVNDKNEVSYESPSDANLANVRNYVYRSANPNPVVVIAFVLIIIVLIHFIYTLYVKPSFSGKWTDGKDKFHIEHNLFTNSAVIHQLGRPNINALTYGPAIHTVSDKTRLGVMTITNKSKIITWLDGGVWTKITSA